MTGSATQPDRQRFVRAASPPPANNAQAGAASSIARSGHHSRRSIGIIGTGAKGPGSSVSEDSLSQGPQAKATPTRTQHSGAAQRRAGALQRANAAAPKHRGVKPTMPSCSTPKRSLCSRTAASGTRSLEWWTRVQRLASAPPHVAHRLDGVGRRKSDDSESTSSTEQARPEQRLALDEAEHQQHAETQPIEEACIPVGQRGESQHHPGQQRVPVPALHEGASQEPEGQGGEDRSEDLARTPVGHLPHQRTRDLVGHPCPERSDGGAPPSSREPGHAEADTPEAEDLEDREARRPAEDRQQGLAGEGVQGEAVERQQIRGRRPHQHPVVGQADEAVLLQHPEVLHRAGEIGVGAVAGQELPWPGAGREQDHPGAQQQGRRDPPPHRSRTEAWQEGPTRSAHPATGGSKSMPASS